MSPFHNFQPVCILPNSTNVHVSWVLGPDVRSSFGILWSCLATFIACTHLVIHVDVPEVRKGHVGSGQQLSDYLSLGVLKWWLLFFIIPEAVWYWSFLDFLAARKQRNELHKAFPPSRRDITLTHMLFANMGGFQIKIRSRSKRTASKSQVVVEESRPLDNERLNSSAAVDEESGAALHADSSELEKSPESVLVRIDGPTLSTMLVQEYVLLKTIPSKEAIMDRSKRDYFAKTVTGLQLIYFGASVVHRVFHRWMEFEIHSRAISQLELTTMAFCCITLPIYALVFCKPKSVSMPITIGKFEEGWEDELLELIESVPRHNGLKSYLERCLSDCRRPEITPDPKWSMTFSTPFYLALFCPSLFAVPYGFAWDGHFPSTTELYLWRIATIAMFSLFVTAFLPDAILEHKAGATHTRQDMRDLASGSVYIAACIVVAQYSLARSFLLVESVRCLFNLPAEAFVATNWINFPHIG